MRVLVVEDNARLRSLIAEHLAGSGFAVDAVASVDEAAAAISTGTFDIMLLDLGLPDGDGADVLLEARARTGGLLPVVVITARDELKERLRLLNTGADDFILKPFEMLELEARVRAVLRRPGMRTGQVLDFDDLSFDVAAREAHSNGDKVHVARRELALLEELMRAKGRIVIREALEDRLYAFNEPVTPNALEQSISRLRRALRDASSGVSIETKRGIGYRLASTTAAAA